MAYYKCGSVYVTNNSDVRIGTASGGVANFNTSLALPLMSLEVDVNAVQSAGTPAPTSPLPISGWNKITLVNCGNKYKPNIKPFNEWEIARSDYYISRFSVPNTIITVNLIDKDTTVDLTGVAFGFVDSYWNTANPITTNEYRWFIQNGTPQTTKRNVAIADANKVLSGLIFSPQNEATYNKLMARYDYEFVFSETSDVEPYNTEVINLGGTFYNGGTFTQDKAGHRTFTADGVTTSLPDGEPIITLNGTNNIFADTGDCAVEYKVSVEQYVSNHSGGGLGGGLLGGGLLGGSPNPEESESESEGEE